MAEEASESESTHQPPPPRLPFVEVECRISKKKRRFASGTKAGFAVSLINRKMDGGNPTPTPTPTPLAFAIEAVKDGEEPVSFGPDAPLVDYGNAWNLKAVTDSDYPPLTKPAAPAAVLLSSFPFAHTTIYLSICSWITKQTIFVSDYMDSKH
ncbi:hypothetical protein LINPERPRIM_LOCUS10950 [Linum perenne]